MAASASKATGDMPSVLDELWDVDYVNEDHIKAFAQALAESDLSPDAGDQSPTSPKSPPMRADSVSIDNEGNEHRLSAKSGSWNHGPQRQERVEKVKALSDFAPIHQRVSTRRKPQAITQGWSFHLIRWPLLGFIFVIISCEFGLYVFTRQVVNVFEYITAFLGGGSKRRLRNRMRRAETYDEWREAAKEMDRYLGFEEWKQTEEDSLYDYALVRKVKRTLAKLKAANDVRGMMDVLEICLRSNFAGSESVRLYSETFYGTKVNVEEYVAEVEKGLEFVRESNDISSEEKRRFFRAANKNYGSSALCLSGGASFGYYHFGVVKAFIEADLLPRVVTGTSAGGLVAALTCTRTDAELKRLLVPELADKITACEDPVTVWAKRFWKTGARFDTIEWARRAAFFTRGSLTFREAYERTGRALNVSVIPHDRHSPTKLLNYLTSPNCVIWSAIIASAAVPGILNSVVLMQKTKDGSIKPMNWGSRFKDGSLRVDIPLQSLHLLFNVNHSIVSQVNPHVHLFFFAPRGAVGKPVAHRKGKGWRGGFVLSAMEQYLKLELTKNFKVIRDLELLPTMLGQDWSSVFLQKFEGSVTIWPRTRFRDWIRILTDPDRAELARMLRVGQLVAWPKLHMIDNRLKIERNILRGRSEVRAAIRRDRITTTDEPGSPQLSANGGPASAQIPIESDADLGFAKRNKHVHRGALDGTPSASGLSTPALGTSNALAMSGLPKRPYRRTTRESAKALLSDSDSSDNGPVQPDYLSPPSSPERHSQTLASTIGSSFQKVRTQSFPSFTSSFSPFRSLRGSSPLREEIEPVRIKRAGSASSRRWFGAGGSRSALTDSSSSEDEAELGSVQSGPRVNSSSSHGTDLPSFRFVQEPDGLQEAPVGYESDSEGEVAVNGERVDEATIAEAAAEGEGIKRSSPQQDS